MCSSFEITQTLVAAHIYILLEWKFIFYIKHAWLYGVPTLWHTLCDISFLWHSSYGICGCGFGLHVVCILYRIQRNVASQKLSPTSFSFMNAFIAARRVHVSNIKVARGGQMNSFLLHTHIILYKLWKENKVYYEEYARGRRGKT